MEKSKSDVIIDDPIKIDQVICLEHGLPIGATCDQTDCEMGMLLCILCAADKNKCIRKLNHKAKDLDIYLKEKVEASIDKKEIIEKYYKICNDVDREYKILNHLLELSINEITNEQESEYEALQAYIQELSQCLSNLTQLSNIQPRYNESLKETIKNYIYKEIQESSDNKDLINNISSLLISYKTLLSEDSKLRNKVNLIDKFTQLKKVLDKETSSSLIIKKAEILITGNYIIQSHKNN